MSGGHTGRHFQFELNGFDNKNCFAELFCIHAGRF